MFNNNQSIFKKTFPVSYSIKIIQEKNSDLPFNFPEWGIVKDMQKQEDRDHRANRRKDRAIKLTHKTVCQENSKGENRKIVTTSSYPS